MLIGHSVYHVHQGVGKIYSKNDIKGYYNDLTEKITRFGRNDNNVPKTYVDTGEEIEFSIAIFQYGLASYDLYLLSGKQDKNAFVKMISCAEWAISNQQEDGAWVTFAYENPDYPYSSMAQGQGISLLLRAYLETLNEKYMKAAQKAKDFMLLPIEDGGTTKYKDDRIYLYECPREPLILNGWIFSLWGLIDYVKATRDRSVKEIIEKSLETLETDLPSYDLGYWSKYEDKKRISSPFYHKLHIAQLDVMYELTGKAIFYETARKWEKYSNNWIYRKIAFIRKALQKIIE